MEATDSRRPAAFVLFCLSCSLLSIHAPRAASLSFNFNFSDPGPFCGATINCTGFASVVSDKLELTRKDTAEGGHGRASYAQPVPLWDNATGELASFATTFSFQITPAGNPDHGDGLAFFLAHYPSKIPPDSGGENLGLLPANKNGTGDGRIVAVEFDTWDNKPPIDVSGNHIGIDVNSIISVASTDTTSPTRNLTSGFTMTAMIKYDNGTRMLTVDLQINDTSYHVNATVDLRSYLPEEVAVGFSATSGVSAELHRILSWSFSSTLASKTTPAPPPLASKTTPAPPPPTISSKLSKKVQVLLSVLVPVLFLLVCAAVGFLLWQRRMRRRPNKDSDSDSEDQCGRAELERGVAAGPRRYTYHELAAATSNFAEEEKLGRGGFGSVYRGRLGVGDRDRPVAVKMFSAESSAQGRKEFEAEVRIISQLKHRNLVQLLGWCDSRKGLLLVYELVMEGSLDKHLYNNERLLTWPERYQIIIGLGSALRYLHEEWEQCIVHGDIKPSNIMLDSSHSTKLGDFGLARLVDHGTGWQTTKAVLGTAGYIDPEFVNTRRPSTESDVYSFGIVLLEIVSGRRPVVETSEGLFMLLRWVWSLYGRDAILDAADERLRGDELEERRMERVLVVGLWCAHPDRSERPSVAQAMHVLHSEDVRLPALTSQMYKTVPNALSIDSSSGVRSWVTTDETTLSSDSSSTALLRNSKDLA